MAAEAAGGKTLPQISVDDVDAYGHVDSREGKETLLDVSVESSNVDASKVDGEVGVVEEAAGVDAHGEEDGTVGGGVGGGSK